MPGELDGAVLPCRRCADRLQPEDRGAVSAVDRARQADLHKLQVRLRENRRRTLLMTWQLLIGYAACPRKQNSIAKVMCRKRF